eukprot:g2727.t1
METIVKLVNQPSPQALDYADQLVQKEGGRRAVLTNEQLLLGATAYTKSAIDFAKQPLSVMRSGAKELSTTNDLGITERTTNGTILTHLYKKRLDRCVPLVLKIELGTLTNAVAREYDSNGEEDPFVDPLVVFTTGITMETSTIARDKTNPEWNSTHYLFLRKNTMFDSGVHKLNIHVLDFDAKWLRKNISFDELMSQSKVLGSKSYNIDKDFKRTGRHSLSVAFNRGEVNKDDQMKLRLHYQVLTAREYLTEVTTIHCNDWFDEKPLQTPNKNLRSVFEAAKVSPVTFRPLIHFQNKTTSTEGWVHTDIKKNVVIVTFKEIYEVEEKELQTRDDSDRVFMESMAGDNYTLKLTDAVKNTENVTLHKGFLNAYESIRESLLETVRSFCWNWDDRWLVVFTGECIGGALASIAAYEFANRKLHGNGVCVQMMSYGSPPVGNRAFIKSYADTVPVSYRLRYEKDTFTDFPCLLKHVPNMVKIKADKTLHFIFPGPVSTEDEEEAIDEQNTDAEVMTKAGQERGKTDFFISRTFEAAITAEFKIQIN